MTHIYFADFLSKATYSWGSDSRSAIVPRAVSPNLVLGDAQMIHMFAPRPAPALQQNMDCLQVLENQTGKHWPGATGAKGLTQGLNGEITLTAIHMNLQPPSTQHSTET